MLDQLKKQWDKNERILVTYRERIYRTFEREENISDWLGQPSPFKLQLLDSETEESTSLNEIFRKDKHIQIIGLPGSGKTALTKYIAAATSQGKISGLPNLPIIIQLSSYRHSDVLLYAIQKQFTYFTESKLEDDEIKKLLLQGRIIVLLDGLEECSQPEKVKVDIQEFVHKYPDSPIVVTSRDTFQSSIRGFRRAKINPLQYEDIRIISNQLCTKYSVDSKKLWLNLVSNSTLLSLAKNPLLLQVIVQVYKDQPQKALSVSDLIESWINTRLHSVSPEKKDALRNLATGIAYYLDHNDKTEFTLAEIENLPNDQKTGNMSIEKKIQLLCENGILDKTLENSYHFVHQLFQEYFSTRFMSFLDTTELVRSLKDEEISKKWFTKCLFLDEKINNDNLIIQLLDSNESEAKQYVADLLIDNPTSTSTCQLALTYLFKEEARSTTWAFRTFDALASLNDYSIMNMCHDKLSQKNLSTWESALAACLLSMQGESDNKVLEYLFQAARDNNAAIRVRAYRALFAAKSNAALTFIVDRMKSEKDENAFNEILAGLESIQDIQKQIPASAYGALLVELEKRYTLASKSDKDRLSQLINQLPVINSSNDKGQ